ncbi:hypothetical protein FKM82_018043 [Ascaphus truei]
MLLMSALPIYLCDAVACSGPIQDGQRCRFSSSSVAIFTCLVPRHLVGREICHELRTGR